MALAAFQRARLTHGVAETRPNLAFTYSYMGDHDRALEEADHAVREAAETGDETLAAQTLRVRAEIRVLRGDVQIT